jgi:putative transposase
MGETRRKFDKDFREGAVRLVRETGKPIAQMGRPGSALDNAVIESWHSTLEFELRRVQHFATKEQARTAVPAWIEDYNTRRRHTACRKMPPATYEQLLAARGEAA